MRRMLLFACMALAIGTLGYTLRVRDAPYIAYERGEVQGALSGFAERAKAGDGFAAYLMGRAYHSGNGVAADQRAAADWYITAARAGELRAIPAYLGIVLGQGTDTCRTAVALLDLATRTGEMNALISLGELYKSGRCSEKDPVRAASYFQAAARLDRRLRPLHDDAMAALSAEQAQAVKPPAAFDLEPRDVLARFLTEAPGLLPDNLR